MRSITLLLMGLILLGGIIMVSGCAGVMTAQRKHEALTEYINVTSEPSDAEIYFNNMLIGRTPCKSLPISIPAYRDESLVFGSSTRTPSKQCYLRISKKGYNDAIKPIEFEYVRVGGLGYYELEKADYHFTLEKEE